MEIFKMGGFVMWITTLFGVLFLVYSAISAFRDNEHKKEIAKTLMWITLVSGMLGFTIGAVNSIMLLNKVDADKRFLTIVGFGESLVNIAYSLGFILIGLVIILIGRGFIKK
jgi:hypothetical protein